MTTKEMIAVMQAYEEGRQIQCKRPWEEELDWVDASSPVWNWHSFDYRIKPRKEEKPVRMTNRQLAEWCAMGKGLWKHDPSNSGTVYHYYWFLEPDMNKEVSNAIVIMPKGSDDWIEPTVDIYERDCKKV